MKLLVKVPSYRTLVVDSTPHAIGSIMELVASAKLMDESGYGDTRVFKLDDKAKVEFEILQDSQFKWEQRDYLEEAKKEAADKQKLWYEEYQKRIAQDKEIAALKAQLEVVNKLTCQVTEDNNPNLDVA